MSNELSEPKPRYGLSLLVGLGAVVIGLLAAAALQALTH